jgi:UDP-N-acetylglucosamine--N-acetylmuramyl-(pentapeptide) pyrophosphoryl-undecaprenol N-acetylglucosamine transferase
MGIEKIRICLTGGSTGGHLIPLILVTRFLKEKAKETRDEVEFFYLGPEPIKREILEKEGIKIYILPEIKLRKYFSLENFLDFLKSPFVFLKILWILFWRMPNVIFSKGGPTSFLVVLAGWFLRIPILIHESDSIPGLANKLSSRFATRIAVSFVETKKFFPEKKTAFTGHPVDTLIFSQPIFEEDYKRFKLNPEEKITVVLGGSQGSKFINDLILDSLDSLLKITQIVHITGEKNFAEVYETAKGLIMKKVPMREKNYHAYPFLNPEDLALLLKLSNLVISRAGAGSIFEIAMAGVPSILIPIRKEVAGDHQIKNAYIYSQHGACIVLEENNATPSLLLTSIRRIFENPEVENNMRKNAKSFAKPEALQLIGQEIWHLAKMHYA